jgi:hypothetical protein
MDNKNVRTHYEDKAGENESQLKIPLEESLLDLRTEKLVVFIIFYIILQI